MSARLESISTLWLELSNKNMGMIAKMKVLPRAISKNIPRNLVPIELNTLNIKLSTPVKCRRTQFPVVPACALTIHKSQGGTYDELEYKYITSQSQPLVYVAMTTLEGLFITTKIMNRFVVITATDAILHL